MTAARSPTTSPTLLELLGLPGNEAAWGRFVQTYDPLIRDCCRAARLQPADADDVRARVLLALTTAMKGFRYDPARRFRGYLRTTVVNVIRRLRRERARHPDLQAAGGDASRERLELVPDPAGFIVMADEIEADLHVRLRVAGEAMSAVRAKVAADTWRMFWETTIEDRPAADVAAQFGYSVGSVYTAKYRVRKLLNDEGEQRMRSPTGPEDE